MLAAGLIFIYDAVRTAFFKEKNEGPDPWNINDIQQTLDWTVPSPPPEYNFAEPPEIK